MTTKMENRVKAGEYIVWGCLGGEEFATKVDKVDSEYVYSRCNKFRRTDGIKVDGCCPSLTCINVLKTPLPYKIRYILHSDDEYCEWKCGYIRRGDGEESFETKILKGIDYMYCWDSEEMQRVIDLLDEINERFICHKEKDVNDVIEGEASIPIKKDCEQRYTI